MNEMQKNKLAESTGKILDKFSKYFSKDVEIEREVYFEPITVNGKEREIVCGRVIYSEPVPESDRAGNWAVTRRLKELVIKPQIHIYELGYKVERISGSDSGFGARHAVSEIALKEIASMDA